MVESKRERGFTYLLALFAVGVAGLAAIKAVPVLQTFEQRQKEEELIFVGSQYRNAIGSYYENTPGSVKKFPIKLDELIIDKRFVSVRRHLRRLYVDPMNPRSQWGIIPSGDGGIAGVYSVSDRAPLKKIGFGSDNSTLNGKSRYSEWKFSYQPKIENRPPNSAITPSGSSRP